MNGCPFGEGPHDYQFQLHHAIPRQTLKGHYSWWNSLTADARASKGLPQALPALEEVLVDRRNLVPICARHHEAVTNHRVYVTRDMLPAGIDDFAQELGLVWYLERYFDHEDRVA